MMAMTTINEIAPLLYGPSWQTPLAETLGVSIRTVQRWARGERQVGTKHWRQIAELMRERREELRRAVAALQSPHQEQGSPDADRALLSMTAQQKLEAAIRQAKRRLELEFAERLHAEVRKWEDDIRLPNLTKQHDEYQRVIKARRGVMTRAVYRKIWSCLHPDRIARFGDTDLTKLFQEAFDLFSHLELVLLNEAEHPTPVSTLPSTVAEWEAMKAKATAERRAKRQQQRAGAVAS